MPDIVCREQLKEAISEDKQHLFSFDSSLYDLFMTDIDEVPTIDPETLPIVRELRKELEQVTRERDEARRDCAVAESNHSECLVQLAEARVKLKSAITDMEALMWHSGDGCEICEHKIVEQRYPYTKLGCKLNRECNPKWRGIQEVQEDE